MSTAVLVGLAESIVATLLAVTDWELTPAVVRSYVPTLRSVDSPSTPLVQVVPRATEISNLTRSTDRHLYTVSVAVRGRVADAECLDQVDRLMRLAEQVVDALRRSPPTVAGVSWLGIEHDPVFDGQALRERGEFISVIQVQYWSGR